jgi:hypothetical protein
MDAVAVDSSVLSLVTFSPEHRLLELEFRSGAVYQYFDVPPQTYSALLAADSKGEYFNAHIRNRFHCMQIRAPSTNTWAAR